ncbi:DNA-binding transcriptional activator of the SARP family [Actinoplanes philippinensis]|uniref:DNA-binding transcriptional activator of the SARP family n=1 Tax=Actinoplanes philippinensis TaxID=35752 RepID=A0A1I2B438_9ACTN|nr:BTAD domain-containing putative transcriptional regulator [Actinoplanes philippinensis]SFE50952.1 DNA-binding transcriptional activator of the SARP family [Actinoplanes philippinensis]
MRFSLLGPVAALTGSADLPVGTPQQRGLLALLLLRDAPVPIDDIVDALWGERPPASARSTVRTYASRLRQTLAGAGPDGPLLHRTAAGYRLDRRAATLDTVEFTGLLDRAAALRRSGDLPAAAAALRRALDLWSGPALGGAQGEFAATQRVRLDGLRRTAREQWCDLQLALGAHETAGAELAAAVSEEPLNGRLIELWMTALHRGGRTAEALDAFRTYRSALADELGIEPGAEIQALHQRVLRGDPAPAAVAPPSAPDELPADLPVFTGRAEETAWLGAVVSGPGPAVVGITGLGGSGKTTLAVHVAHRLRDRFPEGRLFVDLGTRTGSPASPFDVLGGLLRSVSPTSPLPASLAERSALWRTTSARRRLLLVLDDAADSAQVAPLLPSGAGCAVLVTAVRRLLDLPTARWRRLGALSAAEALHLLGAIAGHDRVAREPAAAARLVGACSHQPLSVRVAAARLLDRPGWTVERIMAQLDDDLRRPVVMHEDCKIVDAPIRRAEAGLRPSAARVFRIGALPATAERSVEDVMLMLRLSRPQARAALEDLVDAHLVEESAADLYRYPVLVQAYARRRAEQVEGPGDCRTALARLAAGHAPTTVTV